MADDKKSQDKDKEVEQPKPEPAVETKVEPKPLSDPLKAARLEEARRRIENETVADVGLDRRKEHEHEMAGRQAQEQLNKEAERAEEMRQLRESRKK